MSHSKPTFPASSLDPFFSPRSVAVIGASSRPEAVGNAVLRNLLHAGFQGPGEGQRSAGFPGGVYAVNPKGGEIFGETVYPSLEALPEVPDLLVVAIPPPAIPGLLEQAGAAGSRAAIVISAGFGELGAEGRKLQQDLAQRANDAGLRVVGPNCLGVLRPSTGLNASFSEAAPPSGPIALLSQSGAVITGFISYARREQFGLSCAVSLGAKADVEDEDVLDWLVEDELTRGVALYVESFPEPRRFLEAASRLAAVKPVVAIHGGATAAGARAASSHTGSLAGSAAAYSAAFRQAGVMQAHTLGEFMAWTRALAYQKPAAGKRVAILTNAGGPGVLCADHATRRGLEVVTLSPRTLARLNEVLPAVWSKGNPIDVIGDAGADRYRKALEILGKAQEVDALLVILTVQAMTDPRDVADAVIDAVENSPWDKPLVCSFMGLTGTATGALLDAHGIPEFDVPEEGIDALVALVSRGEWNRRQPVELSDSHDLPPVDLEAARRQVAEAQAAGQRNLDLDRARQVLAAAGLPYNRSATVANEEEAVRAASEVGYSLVAKVVSSDVVHKSDVGGVELGISSEEELLEACGRIRERIAANVPGAVIEGFTLEEQVSGTEIIVGMSRDPHFGPLLMVGLGGIFVEVYQDVSFRPVPISPRDGLRMIDEIRAQPLLDGARGRPAVDRGELLEILLRVSRLVAEVPAIEELDVNPLVITERGLVAIDARVIVGEEGSED